MAERDGHLHEVLGGYAKFLQDKNLALDKQQPYLVRWVREFLLFARAHGAPWSREAVTARSRAGGNSNGARLVAAYASNLKRVAVQRWTRWKTDFDRAIARSERTLPRPQAPGVPESFHRGPASPGVTSSEGRRRGIALRRRPVFQVWRSRGETG